MPLLAARHGGQGQVLDEVARAVGRIGPGNLVGQVAHHFPLRKQALDGVGVFARQRAQDQAGVCRTGRSGADMGRGGRGAGRGV